MSPARSAAWHIVGDSMPVDVIVDTNLVDAPAEARMQEICAPSNAGPPPWSRQSVGRESPWPSPVSPDVDSQQARPRQMPVASNTPTVSAPTIRRCRQGQTTAPLQFSFGSANLPAATRDNGDVGRLGQM